jgi:hypothetical protein
MKYASFPAFLLAFWVNTVIGGTWVNDSGAWKEAREIWVNQAGTWKAVQQQWVNDAGTWQMVFSLTVPGYQYGFEWELDPAVVSTTSGFTVYLNGTSLCTVTGGDTTTVTCNDTAELPYPAVFTVTRTDTVDGESDPSNALWAAGYPDWQAATAYAAGDQVSAGDAWPYNVPMVATVAGTSGVTEPTWPVRRTISTNAHTLNAAAAVDNSANTAGTVAIAITGHGYAAGDVVYLQGASNYSGYHALPDQTDGGVDTLIITAPYVAETFTGAEVIYRTSDVAVIDNGDGTLDVPCYQHGYVAGDEVTLPSSTVYTGTYTLPVQANPNAITITSTYSAESLSGYAVDKTVVDGGVTWTLTEE